MRIFTKEEAESITKYYSEILIGKPITPPGDSNPFSITSLDIKKVNDGYTVYCICNIVAGKSAYSNIEKVISQSDYLPLEEFLTNQY